jgi:hypothetical protein
MTGSIKVTTQDINSVSDKLHALKQQLSPGEQNVLDWLLDRAASAPQEKADVLKQTGGAGAAGSHPQVSARGTEFNKALGISQFSKAHPGAAAAGSSVGVTGTVMF